MAFNSVQSMEQMVEFPKGQVVKRDADFRRYTQILIIFIFLIQNICVHPPANA
jgi:hypothetical protein